MSDSDYRVIRNAHLPRLDNTPEPLTQAYGVLCFAATPPSTDVPQLQIAMPLLAGNTATELWLGDVPLATETIDGIRYRRSDDLVFGVIELADGAHAGPLQLATEAAYRRIFALLDGLGMAHVYRFWNYIPQINTEIRGLERYRQFNLGRQDAYLASGRTVSGQLPAACALGVSDGPLQIAFLAGKAAGEAVENPRQISAYDYPKDYGPRSPTFSRACLLRLPEGEALFVSGTASIVGHRTLHAGDATAQTRETLANVEAVIMEANRQLQGRHFDPAQLHYRVYVRDAADLPAIQAELRRLTGRAPEAVFLQADICRSDLLLEIETTAYSRPLIVTDRQ